MPEETCFQQAGSSAVEGNSQAVLGSSSQWKVPAADLKSRKGLCSGPSPIHYVPGRAQGRALAQRMGGSGQPPPFRRLKRSSGLMDNDE